MRRVANKEGKPKVVASFANHLSVDFDTCPESVSQRKASLQLMPSATSGGHSSGPKSNLNKLIRMDSAESNDSSSLVEIVIDGDSASPKASDAQPTSLNYCASQNDERRRRSAIERRSQDAFHGQESVLLINVR